MSNVPLRRTTRTSRPTTTANDPENANARPSRVLTRSKAPAVVSQVSRTSRATAPTVASKGKTSGITSDIPVGKRKREVLVEVTGVANNNVRPVSGTVKGKADNGVAEGVNLKSRPAPKPARESLRKVLKPVARKTQRTVSGAVAQATHDTVGLGDVVSKQTTVPVEQRAAQHSLKRTTSIHFSSAADDDETRRAFKKRHTQSSAAAPDIQDVSEAEADKIAADLAAIEEEPEEKNRLWDDLDEGDWDDPTMVSEYVAEVCVYLKETELATLPDPNYMNRQSEIDWEKRGILVDWVLQVHARFQMLQETLFLFTNILDRFLSVRPISLSKLQLVGITCFFIAAKFEETYAPSVKEIAYLMDGQATIDDVIKAERYILKTIGWDLRYPGPMGWLRRGSKADDCEIKARTVAKYLIEIGCLEWRLVATLPSLLAAAALWLARLVLGREEWTPNLEHYTTYSEEQLLPTANIMLNYILEPVEHPSLFQKYAHKRHLKCSLFMKQWACIRWAEGTEADLAKVLPEIKAEIRFERENDERELGGN